MHIVFISNEYPLWATGGKGSFIQTLGRGLVDAGHEVKVLGIGVENKIVKMDDRGVQLIRLPKPNLPKAKFIENFWRIRRELKRIEKNTRIDIVETSELDCAYLPKKTWYKKVIRLHGGHHFFAEAEKRGIDPVKGAREKKSFANADGFIAVSSYVKEHTSKYLSYHGKPIEIIRNSIDLKIFQPQSVAIEKGNITYVGTVCEKKGVRQLIQAMSIVLKEKPNVRLHIYGRDWNYPDGSSYIEEMKSTYDMKNIEFHGMLPFSEIPNVYARAEVCVFPSHIETQGLVAPEAMAMGKTVVFSHTGPGRETIKDGVNGYLCDPHNPESIAQKIMEAIDHKNNVELNKNAIEFAQKTFNIDQLLPENIELYKSINY